MSIAPGIAKGLLVLPVPQIPGRHNLAVDAGTPMAFTAGHHFALNGDAEVTALAQAATAPLSVIVQVTKRCDFGCVFCSETLQMADPTLAQLETMRDHLAGVGRVFLSGGEPLLRRDLPDIVNMFAGFIIGLPTNATRGMAMAPRLAGKIAFANIGFDGPRATFTRVRGDYDKAMTGVRAFMNAGIPLSLSAVVLRSTLHALPYLCQIADVLDAGKLKLILPLRKGNALGLADREFISVDETCDVFGRLTELRATHDWRPAVRLTPWTKATTVEKQCMWGDTALRPCPVMVWLPAHTGAFLDFIEGERLFALFCLVAYCGLRRGEALGLTWAEVDLKQGVAFIRETGDEDDPKSDAGIRAVPLPSAVVKVLREWRKRQTQERFAWGSDWTETGRVFTREDGSDLSGQWVSVRFETLAYRAGLPPVRFHDLRHGAASLCKAAKLDTKFISALLGHSRSSFTDDTYVHVFPEVAAAAAEAAAAVVPRTQRGSA